METGNGERIMVMTTESTATLFTNGNILYFRYTNYKMETENRRVMAVSIWFGSSQYHQGKQWFLKARDLDRDALRDFAMRDMSDVTVRSMSSIVEAKTNPD